MIASNEVLLQVNNKKNRDSRMPSDLSKNDTKDRQFVNALARGLDILRCFREGDLGLSNAELAQRTNLPKPTVSRLTYTLTQLGYLNYIDRLSQYRLASGVLSLGYAMLANLEIRHLARASMQTLAEYASASVSVGMRDRLQIVYVETCRSSAKVVLRMNVGARIPIATTAMGKAFLAGLPETEFSYLMDHIRLADEQSWARNKLSIEQAKRDCNEHGFCLSIGDWDKEIHAVGVPLTNLLHEPPMAFNCGGPGYLLPRDKLEQDIGPKLVSLVQQVKHDLGHR